MQILSDTFKYNQFHTIPIFMGFLNQGMELTNWHNQDIDNQPKQHLR